MGVLLVGVLAKASNHPEYQIALRFASVGCALARTLPGRFDSAGGLPDNTVVMEAPPRQ